MPENNKRIKDEHREHNHMLEGLTDNTLNFYSELSQYFPDVKVTSGKRSSAQKVGKFYQTSHHNTGNAVDLSGNHSGIYSFLMNDQRGLQLLTKYNLGVIDETDPTIMAKTGATGPHFHIGPEKKYAQIAKQRLENFENITPLFAYIDKEHQTPQATSTENVGKTFSQQYLDQYAQQYTPIQIEQASITPITFDLQSFQTDLEKEKIKEQKIQESEARQKLEVKREERNAILDVFSKIQYITPQNQIEDQNQGYNINEVEFLPVQEGLPTPPNIFQF